MIEHLFDISNLIGNMERLQLKGVSKIRKALADNLKRTYKKRLYIHILQIWEQIDLTEINDLIFSNMEYFVNKNSRNYADIYSIQRMLEKNPMPRSKDLEKLMQKEPFFLQNLFRSYVSSTKSELPWFEELVNGYVEKETKSKQLVNMALHYGQEVYGGIPKIWKDWILSQLYTFKV